MAKITLKGAPINTNGELPAIGSKLPDFVLVDAELNDRSLKDFKGKRKLICTVPSLDTGTCSLSAKKFNESAGDHPELLILFVSCDLPFAQKRLCGSEGLQNIKTLSMLRSKEFASQLGILINDGPLAGLCARSIIVVDENDKVLYRELVSEVTQEPDYQKALDAVKT